MRNSIFERNIRKEMEEYQIFFNIEKNLDNPNHLKKKLEKFGFFIELREFQRDMIFLDELIEKFKESLKYNSGENEFYRISIRIYLREEFFRIFKKYRNNQYIWDDFYNQIEENEDKDINNDDEFEKYIDFIYNMLIDFPEDFNLRDIF